MLFADDMDEFELSSGIKGDSDFIWSFGECDAVGVRGGDADSFIA
jgi:hypothetical protein